MICEYRAGDGQTRSWSCKGTVRLVSATWLEAKAEFGRVEKTRCDNSMFKRKVMPLKRFNSDPEPIKVITKDRVAMADLDKFVTGQHTNML